MLASRFGGVIAGAICIIAGLYLLQTQAVEDDSLLETIMHGMGIYFVGKGVFVWLSLNTQVEIARSLRRVAETPQGDPSA